MATKESRTGELGAGIVPDLQTASLDEVAAALGALSSARRHRLLDDCARATRSARGLADERQRVAVAKLLVALLPDSAEAIERVLQQRKADTPVDVYELHFSLFCFLERAHELGPAATASFNVPELIGEYLREVPIERGHANWMAGELLGEHWRLEEAVPVLLTAAASSRYVYGRLGAVHGLVHALERAGGADREPIVRALRSIARSDRSKRVRLHARGVLDTSGVARTAKPARRRP